VSPSFAPLTLLAALAAAPRPGDLATLAAASPRPEVCGGWPAPSAAAGTWQRARRAAGSQTCVELARGHTLLHRHADQALSVAESLRASPGELRADAEVLAARALVRLGRHAEAWQAFERARERAAAALDRPGALRDLALAAARTDHPADALAALRALLPRASLLEDPADVVRVHVEAAALAMLDGAAALPEAIAYLTQARAVVTAPELDEVVLGMLALALDRAGRRGEARSTLELGAGPWRVEALWDPERPASRRLVLPLLPAGEAHALLAILTGPVDAERAAQHWRAFIAERAGGAFVAHAEQHLQGRRGR
jgi:tetratricopeptide (TPR) repeat protein